MKKGGIGGTKTKSGLTFEGRTDFLTAIVKQPNYSVRGNEIYYKGEKVALSFKKHELYRYLEEKGVDYGKIVTKKLLPDDAIFVIIKNTLYILEIKFQGVTGSTDEKLQTCDFKIKQYRKLLTPLKVKVEYIYVLNDWFKKPEYQDVLDYINSIDGCSYYFNELPLEKLGLPNS